ISLIGAIIVIAGLLKGIFSGQQERQQIRYIERQLRQLHEGQALIEEEYKDLQQVDQLMKQIQQKIAQQIEYAQQLVVRFFVGFASLIDQLVVNLYILQLMKQIQQKIAQQIEYAQQLATEQANEREASLQEIVVEERNRL